MTSRWLHDLKGKEVVFTGDNPGYEEEDLALLAMRLGARRVSDDCNLTTNVLVRGYSPHWKYGNYGKKEKKVFDMQAAGRDVVIIDLQGLLGLVNGTPAPTLAPNVATSPARMNASEGGDFGAPYVEIGPIAPVTGGEIVLRDLEEVDRGRREHFGTQDALAQRVREAGLFPMMRPDRNCNYDLAWKEPDGRIAVAEVKSLTAENEIFQVRHGLGQVLDYAERLRQREFVPRPVLVLESAPKDARHWLNLCASCGVTLTWGPLFEGAIKTVP